jgi:uncharacterized protein with NAD-binding domain and iron-sulfur cluster
MTDARPAKVAIIGGGCAAITTAFELSRPELAGQFDITIYQQGWRLGGKGASGRGPSGRIEEHGLHVWLGFYENAFRLLRECYAELEDESGDSPFGRWRDAFLTEDVIGLSGHSDVDGWYNWSACFPPRPGLPGDPIDAAELFSVRNYLGSAAGLLVALIESLDSRDAASSDEREQARTGFSAASLIGDPQGVLKAIRRLLGDAVSTSSAILIEALAVFQAGLRSLPPSLTNVLVDLALWISDQLRHWLEKGLIRRPYYQHVWEVMDIVVASVVGVLRSGLMSDARGFDAIDDHDWREWLILNGASKRSVQSPFIRGLYDLAMAYEDGDPARPRLSAAAAVRGSLRMFFTYRGALYWKLRAGMGDVIFAPYYEVLRRRGVKFEFFHKLTNVGLGEESETGADGACFVQSLAFDVQARVRGGGEYQPLAMIGGKPCWPSQPDFRQLSNGRKLALEGRDFESHWDTRHVSTKTLIVGQDFDFVVLGISIGAVPHVCKEILARDARWRAMVEHVKTIETQAFQIWLDRNLDDLQWSQSHLIGSAFTKPFDTWSDMAHTIPEEAWEQPPATALYFCGALEAAPAPPGRADYPEQRQAAVKAHALTFLRDSASLLWPSAYDENGTFRWDMLRDASGDPEIGSGEVRLDSQYWTANVNPSDRYVLAVPGSAKFRISPLDMSYANMTITGDWTACGLNEGCVEAAVMSGRLAANALAGVPLLEDIVGYDHP